MRTLALSRETIGNTIAPTMTPSFLRAPESSCARELSPHITGVEIDFAEPSDVAAELSSRGVQVTAKDRHGVSGLRVAPHVYSTMDEVEVFVRALVEVREQLMASPSAKL